MKGRKRRHRMHGCGTGRDSDKDGDRPGWYGSVGREVDGAEQPVGPEELRREL